VNRPTLIFESVLIVASVALGFVVTEWRQRVGDRDLARQVLANVREEIELNIATLEKQIPRHQKLADGLAAEVKARPLTPESAFEVLFRVVNEHGSPDSLPLRRGAWDAAVTSGALRLVDYTVAAALSDVYVGQASLYEDYAAEGTRLVYRPEMFTPDGRDANLEVVRWSLQEMVNHERLLVDGYYKKHLPTIRAAAGR
jgi:hypothetical protein